MSTVHSTMTTVQPQQRPAPQNQEDAPSPSRAVPKSWDASHAAPASSSSGNPRHTYLQHQQQSNSNNHHQQHHHHHHPYSNSNHSHNRQHYNNTNNHAVRHHNHHTNPNTPPDLSIFARPQLQRSAVPGAAPNAHDAPLPCSKDGSSESGGGQSGRSAAAAAAGAEGSLPNSKVSGNSSHASRQKQQQQQQQQLVERSGGGGGGGGGGVDVAPDFLRVEDELDQIQNAEDGSRGGSVVVNPTNKNRNRVGSGHELAEGHSSGTTAHTSNNKNNNNNNNTNAAAAANNGPTPNSASNNSNRNSAVRKSVTHNPYGGTVIEDDFRSVSLPVLSSPVAAGSSSSGGVGGGSGAIYAKRVSPPNFAYSMNTANNNNSNNNNNANGAAPYNLYYNAHTNLPQQQPQQVHQSVPLAADPTAASAMWYNAYASQPPHPVRMGGLPVPPSRGGGGYADPMSAVGASGTGAAGGSGVAAAAAVARSSTPPPGATVSKMCSEEERRRVYQEVLQYQAHLHYPSIELPEEVLNSGETESRQRRLDQRRKQIAYGKDTDGYRAYTAAIPHKEDREYNNERHPVTPRPEHDCSKRTFDKYLNTWRRELHQWDDLTADLPSRFMMGVATLGELGLAPVTAQPGGMKMQSIAHTAMAEGSDGGRGALRAYGEGTHSSTPVNHLGNNPHNNPPAMYSHNSNNTNHHNAGQSNSSLANRSPNVALGGGFRVSPYAVNGRQSGSQQPQRPSLCTPSRPQGAEGPEVDLSFFGSMGSITSPLRRLNSNSVYLNNNNNNNSTTNGNGSAAFLSTPFNYGRTPHPAQQTPTQTSTAAPFTTLMRSDFALVCPSSNRASPSSAGQWGMSPNQTYRTGGAELGGSPITSEEGMGSAAGAQPSGSWSGSGGGSVLRRPRPMASQLSPIPRSAPAAGK